jgi:hypothetical protein
MQSHPRDQQFLATARARMDMHITGLDGLLMTDAVEKVLVNIGES